jgi:hypothetical protein
MLHESLGEDWIWQPAATDATGRPLSRIFTELPGISIFNKSDWHALISFFKPRIIALDAFWENARYSFD